MRRLAARLGTLLVLGIGWAACDDGGGPNLVIDGGGVVPAHDASPAGSDAEPPVPERESPELGACYDELDNDGDGALDCADDGCGVDVAPLCCVGSSDEVCCEETPSEGVAIDLAGCADGPPAGCAALEGLAAFGDPSPSIEDASLVAPDAVGPAGVALGRARDPRAGLLALDGTLRVPTDAMRCADCVDVAGVVFLDAVPVGGASASIRFGVLAIGARQKLVVIVADEVVLERPLPMGDVAVRLETRPDGRGVATLADEALDVGALALPSSVVPVAFVRNVNPPADVESIAVTQASVSARRCDVPRAIVRSPTPVYPSSTSTLDAGFGLGRPSAARDDDDRVFVAVEQPDGIRVLQANGIGELVGPTGVDDRGVEAAAVGTGGVRVRDPWLVAEGNAFALYYVEELESGGAVLWRAQGQTGFARSFAEPEEIVRASDLEVDRLGAVATYELGSERYYVASVVLEGEAALARLEPPGDELGTWTVTPIRAPQRHDLFAFDRDDVSAPAVVVAASPTGAPLIRLYYAGTRGTRRAIGGLVSEDGLTWRPLGEVLGPSAQGFDSLTVDAPAPLDGAEVELFYRGGDGAGYAIGRARPAGTAGE